MTVQRILGIDPGLRVTGFSFGRPLRVLNRLRRFAALKPATRGARGR